MGVGDAGQRLLGRICRWVNSSAHPALGDQADPLVPWLNRRNHDATDLWHTKWHTTSARRLHLGPPSKDGTPTMTTRPTKPVRTPNYPRLSAFAMVAVLAGCNGKTEEMPNEGGTSVQPYGGAAGEAGSGGASTMPRLQGAAPEPFGGAGGSITVAPTTIPELQGAAPVAFGGAGGTTTVASTTIPELQGAAPQAYGGAPSDGGATATDTAVAVGGSTADNSTAGGTTS